MKKDSDAIQFGTDFLNHDKPDFPGAFGISQSRWDELTQAFLDEYRKLPDGKPYQNSRIMQAAFSAVKPANAAENAAFFFLSGLVIETVSGCNKNEDGDGLSIKLKPIGIGIGLGKPGGFSFGEMDELRELFGELKTKRHGGGGIGDILGQMFGGK